MHEFILTLSEEDFSNLENHGIPKNQAIPQIGKLFLDFGFHAPTVAFPEIFGLMIEPTESYTKKRTRPFCGSCPRYQGYYRRCTLRSQDCTTLHTN